MNESMDDRRELTTDEVLAFLAARGRKITRGTWAGYVARGQAPAATRHVGRTPLWDAAAVAAWVESAPGRGARTDLHER